MKTKILIAALGSVLALTGRAAKGEEKSTLQELLAENKNLTVQLDKAKKVEGEIAKAGLAIEGTQSALKRAQQELQRTGSGLVEEGQKIQGQAQQSGCPWGSSSTDKGFVASCNAEGARLTALWKDVQRRGAGLEEYARKLQEEENRLSDATVKWFAKKKDNNTDLQVLYDARTDWLRRYTAFVFHSETYDRLKATAPRPNMCAQGSLEDAAQCLQWLWDGARR